MTKQPCANTISMSAHVPLSGVNDVEMNSRAYSGTAETTAPHKKFKVRTSPRLLSDEQYVQSTDKLENEEKKKPTKEAQTPLCKV